MFYQMLCKLKFLCIYCYNQLCHEKVTKAMPIDIIDGVCYTTKPKTVELLIQFSFQMNIF